MNGACPCDMPLESFRNNSYNECVASLGRAA